MDIIFVNENDNLLEVLANEKIDIRAIMKQLNVINLKLRNNRIGYFQFKVNNECFKICILPKIISKNDDNTKLQEDFIRYLITCIETMCEYNKQNYLLKNINKNLIDIVSKYRNGEVNTLESILQFKYLGALKEIYILLKKLSNYKFNKESFYDHTIRGTINIKLNIVEFNKAKIHQVQKQKVSYDEVANICYSIIEYFIKNKIELIKNNYELKIYSNNIKKYIKFNYEIKDYKFNLKKELSYKVKKIFINRKLEVLLSNLLILLDLDGYFDNKQDYTRYLKYDTLLSIAYDPSLVYEYFVYNNELNNNNIVDFFRINKNQKSDKGIPEYYAFQEINHIEEFDINTAAKPEFIINEEIVKDCKWKIINNLNDIKEEDIEKLKRDCIKKKINRGILVYPLINCEYEKLQWACNVYNSVDDIFIWNIEEQKML